MAHNRRRRSRDTNKRPYKKIFVLSCEGSVTEPDYFRRLDDMIDAIQIEILGHRTKNSPKHVLDRLQNRVGGTPVSKLDEAWLVVDKDGWTDSQLTELNQWAGSDDRFGLAVSNPNFEYWLLLHFEDGSGVHNATACVQKLRNHIAGYNKHVDPIKFSKELVLVAAERARSRDNPPCLDWPQITGTTVYRLVEHMLGADLMS